MAPKSNTVGLQFVGETLLESRLQEPWTQGTVYFDGKTDHQIGQRISFVLVSVLGHLADLIS